MTVATISPGGATGSLADTAGLGGHPRGLTTLFFTEMWERFSFYGMRAILVLYMVALPAQGGLGFSVKESVAIYGTYTMAAFLLCLPGGIIADRFLGARRAVFLGGMVIACGHFIMAFHSLETFYAGLVLVACGTGLLKPNVSTMVGSLYDENDTRRDSGFSLFYMGINIGAFMAPLVCGYLAEADGFKRVLISLGIDPVNSWHFGFAAAGVGMVLGLLGFWFQSERIQHIGNCQVKVADEKQVSSAHRAYNRLVYLGLAVVTLVGTYLAGSAWQSALPFFLAFDGLVLVVVLGMQEKLTRQEWKRMGAIFVFFLVTVAFWSAYEQKGSSLNLLVKNLVDRKIGDFEIPASWFQSLTALYVIILAPIFARMWLRLGDRQPSSPAKFILSLFILGIGYAIFAFACLALTDGQMSPVWIALLFLCEVLGELCMSPVGLSTITKLAPVKLVGLMMGMWFFGSSFGYKLAGYFAGFYAPDSASLVKLYGGIAVGILALAAILFALLPWIRKLTEEPVGDAPPAIAKLT